LDRLNAHFLHQNPIATSTGSVGADRLMGSTVDAALAKVERLGIIDEVTPGRVYGYRAYLDILNEGSPAAHRVIILKATVLRALSSNYRQVDVAYMSQEMEFGSSRLRRSSSTSIWGDDGIKWPGYIVSIAG
jgi:hypothetical protein